MVPPTSTSGFQAHSTSKVDTATREMIMGHAWMWHAAEWRVSSGASSRKRTQVWCTTTQDTQLEYISQNMFPIYILQCQLRPCFIHKVLLEQSSYLSYSLNSSSYYTLIILFLDSFAFLLSNHKDLPTLFSNSLRH